MPPVPHAAEQYKQSQAALSSDRNGKVATKQGELQKTVKYHYAPRKLTAAYPFFLGGGMVPRYLTMAIVIISILNFWGDKFPTERVMSSKASWTLLKKASKSTSLLCIY